VGRYWRRHGRRQLTSHKVVFGFALAARQVVESAEDASAGVQGGHGGHARDTMDVELVFCVETAVVGGGGDIECRNIRL
jgi:hypothetical protein